MVSVGVWPVQILASSSWSYLILDNVRELNFTYNSPKEFGRLLKLHCINIKDLPSRRTHCEYSAEIINHRRHDQMHLKNCPTRLQARQEKYCNILEYNYIRKCVDAMLSTKNRITECWKNLLRMQLISWKIINYCRNAMDNCPCKDSTKNSIMQLIPSIYIQSIACPEQTDICLVPTTHHT